MSFQGSSRNPVMVSVVLLALTTVAAGQQAATESTEARLLQLEKEVVRFREENQRQRIEIASQSSVLQTLLSQRQPSADTSVLPSAHGHSSVAQEVEVEPADELWPLAPGMGQWQLRLHRLETNVDQLQDSLSVSLLDREWSATITGALIGEMIFSEQRPVIHRPLC